MKNRYEIYYNYGEDALDIVKTPSRQPVQTVECKYGIIFYLDINSNVVKISIPEPDVLFGVSTKCIESFLMYSPP